MELKSNDSQENSWVQELIIRRRLCPLTPGLCYFIGEPIDVKKVGLGTNVSSAIARLYGDHYSKLNCLNESLKCFKLSIKKHSKNITAMKFE